jgi:hypothetical protein
MRHPKQIMFTFAAFDRNRQPKPNSLLTESVGLPLRFHKLTVPFAKLDEIKKAINACCAKPEIYSTSFVGDHLARRLQALSHAGCLNSTEVETLITDLNGSTVQFSEAGVVDFEALSANFSTVAFQIFLSIEKNRLAA